MTNSHSTNPNEKHSNGNTGNPIPIRGTRRLRSLPALAGDPSGKLLLRPDEAAEMLGVGVSTMYRLASGGALPSVKIGGSVRFPLEALKRWIETNTRDTGA